MDNLGIRKYGPKDSNPETRKIYDWATNSKLPAESVRNEIISLVNEAKSEAIRYVGINNAEQIDDTARNFLAGKLSKYTLAKIIIPFKESIENARQDIDPLNNEEKSLLQREQLISEMAERAFMNVGYASLAEHIYNYYQKTKP